MTGIALQAENVSKRYGQTQALDNVSIVLRAGQVHGIAGHNGAGKSTLLRILAGAERPDHGMVRLADDPVQLSGPGDALHRGIACVYQELSLAPNLTVAENLFLGQETHRSGWLHRGAMNRTANALLRDFDIDARATDRVGQLPVAVRQLIEILRALHRDATVLLLDEPTTALQPEQIDVLFGRLKSIAVERGVAVAIINHKLDELYAVCDAITALTNGRVVADGAVAEVSRARLTEAIIGNRSTKQAGNAPIGTPRITVPTSKTGLVVRHLGGPRLRDVSFDAHPGRVLGIYGLVGSGRTRTLRSLYGLEPVSDGIIELAGARYLPSTPSRAMRRGISYVSEERRADGFVPGQNAFQNAALPVLNRFAVCVVRWRAAMKAAEQTIGELDLRGNAYGPIERLSGGNQQKALLAKVLLQHSSVLLLDEPTKGIDIGTKSEIHGIVRRLAQDKGVVVIVVSSEEEEILTVADDVIVMRDGVTDGQKLDPQTLDVAELRRLALGTAEAITS